MNKIKSNRLIFVILGLHLLASFLILFLFNGTGEKGSGDSILHYLYSKYAIVNPKLFFNHWAKPLFVLLSFPFAQFGIIGIKLFNIILATLTIFFTYKTTLAIKIKNSLISPIILACTPLYFILTFSGLTEILFGFFTIYCTYLFLQKKYLLAAIIISFLPFVRSEGLIIIGVFGFFLLIKSQWKIIPFLIFGHVIYSFAGYFYYNDILWVFTKIPYAKLSSTYSSGELFHFVHQLFYVIGAPIYFLLIVGIIAIVKSWFNSKEKLFNATSILILGSFLSYFVAHSLFWYLGIFNSMGLKRVMIAVAPFIAIISLFGLNFLIEIINQKLEKTRQVVKWSLLFAIFIFPVSSNKSAIHLKKDFALTNTQTLAKDVVNFINKSNYDKSTFVYTKPYFSELLNINHFDNDVRLELSKENIGKLKTDDIIIWDNWFSVVENGISEEFIRSYPNLKEIKSFKILDGNRETKYIVLKKQ